MSNPLSPDEWKKRWTVWLRCEDCEDAFQCASPSVSLDRIATDENSYNRLVVCGGPEVCPSCKNLKAVKT